MKSVINFFKKLSLTQKFFLWILNTTFWLNFWLIVFVFFYLNHSIKNTYVKSVSQRLGIVTQELYLGIFKPVEEELEKLSYLLKFGNCSEETIKRLSFLTSAEISFSPYRRELSDNPLNFSGILKKDGKIFLAKHFPIKDTKGEIQGVWDIKINLSPYLKIFKLFLSRQNEGPSEYFFVIDAETGYIVYHPFFKVISIKAIPQRVERTAYLELTKKHEGKIRYKGLAFETGTNTVKKKILVFKEFKPFHWIIGVSIYEDKIKDKIVANIWNFAKSTIFIITAGQLIFLALALYVINNITQNIKNVSKQIKKIVIGEVERIEEKSLEREDEVGELLRAVNELITSIEALKDFKKLIEGDETLEDVYERMAKTIKKLTGVDECVIYEVSNSKNTMKLVYPYKEVNLPCKMDVFIDANLCRTKRTAHLVNGFRYPDICKYFTQPDKYFHLCFPIMSGGNVGGILQILLSKASLQDKNEQWLKQLISKVKHYIKEAEPVIETKRLMHALKESTLKDPLTGLFNRRFLEESYEHIVSGILRRGTLLGILMCDIDYFKQVNDLYGHDVGDKVLKTIATELKNSVRNSDIVIRWGGEEFLILLLDIQYKASLDVAEKIRKRISEVRINIGGKTLQKTISIGVSEFPVDTEDFWEAIKFADIALYRAKELGRNRCVRFTPELTEVENIE